MNGAAQPARVLVVDDDPDMLLVIEAALSDEGLQVQTAADGPSAIDLMQLRPPDLLILDVTLPSMDSSSVAERMRELRGDAAPVLVITADGRAAEKARTLRAYGYLRKPFELTNLITSVLTGLQR
ncbi:MAG: response regulator [Chloroflexi bacterium]|nr:response regulator [Chloroflexota bacterium]MBV9898386.1 response regulator [Chloroflexota bacterium]